MVGNPPTVGELIIAPNPRATFNFFYSQSPTPSVTIIAVHWLPLRRKVWSPVCEKMCYFPLLLHPAIQYSNPFQCAATF